MDQAMNRRSFFSKLSGLTLAGLLFPKLKGKAEPVTVKIPKSEPALNYEALLWAIAEKESGNDDTAIGRNGERSKYQISHKVWMQWERNHFGNWPNDCAGVRAEIIANWHLAWLSRELTKAKLDGNSPFLVAHAWLRGLDATLHDCTSTEAADYAKAVCNLYHDLLKTFSA